MHVDAIEGENYLGLEGPESAHGLCQPLTATLGDASCYVRRTHVDILIQYSRHTHFSNQVTRHPFTRFGTCKLTVETPGSGEATGGRVGLTGESK